MKTVLFTFVIAVLSIAFITLSPAESHAQVNVWGGGVSVTISSGNNNGRCFPTQQTVHQPIRWSAPFTELGRWCENGVWYVKLQLNPGYRQVTRSGCMSQCYWDGAQPCTITFNYGRFHNVSTTNSVWHHFINGTPIVVIVPL